MEELKQYLRSLSPHEKVDFARRIGTTIGYLRKALSVGAEFGIRTCVAIERESGGAVTVDDLIPDVDWGEFAKRRGARLIASKQASPRVAQ